MNNLIRNFAASLLAVAVTAVGAQAKFPDRPVKIIVPYAPGGGTDGMTRVVARKLSEIWGQPVLIDNKGGAQGNIGAALGANAPPDGYTLTLIIHSAMAINPHMFKNMGFDPQKDLVPIGRATETPYALVVNAAVPAKNIKEMVALTKSRPGFYNYASSAVGPQVAGELIKSSTGADMLHVPFNGAGAALSAVLSGDVQIMISAPVSVVPHVKSGKLRLLAILGKDGSNSLPGSVTAAEQGFPELADISEWYGFAVPAKTPAPIIASLNAGLVAAMNDAAVQAAMRAQGLTASPSTPQELSERMQIDYERWGKVIRKAGIKLD